LVLLKLFQRPVKQKRTKLIYAGMQYVELVQLVLFAESCCIGENEKSLHSTELSGEISSAKSMFSVAPSLFLRTKQKTFEISVQK